MYAKVRVRVLTGLMKGAGTDADVYISFRNRHTGVWSPEHFLDTPKDDFERGQMDVFKLEIGMKATDVDYIRVRHDNSGKRPGWFLSMVVVEDIDSQEYVSFPFNHWLSLDKDSEDGLSAEIKGYPGR